MTIEQKRISDKKSIEYLVVLIKNIIKKKIKKIILLALHPHQREGVLQMSFSYLNQTTHLLCL